VIQTSSNGRSDGHPANRGFDTSAWDLDVPVVSEQQIVAFEEPSDPICGVAVVACQEGLLLCWHRWTSRLLKTVP
jgi:hypothetical protein